MDALKAEIATKRKAIQDDPLANRPNKYMRRGDIERLREQEAQKARDEKLALEQAEAARKATVVQSAKDAREENKVSQRYPIYCPCPNTWMENSHRLPL